MGAPQARAKAIFLQALELTTVAERAAYLDAQCGRNAELRREVQELLCHHGEVGSFLASPLTAVTESAEQLHSLAPPPPSLDFLSASSRADSLGRLGHYEILEVVGSGGMGIVLKAFDERLQRVVAIKALAPSLVASATGRRRFVREAQAAAAVNHDNVVDVYGVEETGPVPYLVMEYVAGISLEDKLQQQGPMELKEILRIGLQTADGLAAAHRQGLVHRDVKPANILLENGVGRVKITDFGLARAADDVSVTQTGVIAGTPAYMSPEQARGEAVDHRSDLFSLGSVLYALCTGRTPFRSSTALGMLKQVCEELPHPIRDLNPDIPEWLCAIVDKLHDKLPEDRFQSAGELAEALGRYLAYVQQPSLPMPTGIVPVAAPQKPRGATTAKKSRRAGRSWMVAALVLLGLTLSLTDALGITQVAATVIRIFTPDGTLVVETDDPAVKVTIEGDGGLIITGAGLEEIRLRRGSYKVHADKDGKPVPLERELISIARGGREVVKVKLETAPAMAAAKEETGAFVLLAGDTERKFDTLADAVYAASDGDTIEVHGTGPFVSEPISCRHTALHIRAGTGFHPIIKMRPEVTEGKVALLTTNAALMLEGLEFQRARSTKEEKGIRMAVNSFDAPLWAANCRFLPAVWSANAPQCVFRNCDFHGSGFGVGAQRQSGSTFIFENCLHGPGGSFKIGFSFPRDVPPRDASIRIRRSTFASSKTSLAWSLKSPLSELMKPSDDSMGMDIEVADSIFDVQGVLGVEQGADREATVEPAEAEETLLRLVRWRGERNLFAGTRPLLAWSAAWKLLPQHGPQTLDEWKRFWNTTESGSLEGLVQFQGGDLASRTDSDRLTPDDFRLREGSPGYRALEGGKDLGADIDLVGPGAAYELWKKTPEYKVWLKETVYFKDGAAAKSEPGAFVLLGGQGVAERKFDTLAEAVQASSDGDTIEVRGNGPFVTPPVKIGNWALAIRAAEGYRPVIQLSPEGGQAQAPWIYALLHSSAPLTIEGLQFEWLGQKTWKQGPPSACLISADGNSLHVANCRFCLVNLYSNRPNHIYCIKALTPACYVRNCEFLTPIEHAISIATSSRTFVLENCLHLGNVAMNLVHGDIAGGAEFVLSRNTLVTKWNQAIHCGERSEAEQLPQGAAARAIGLAATGNIFDAKQVLHFFELPGRPQALKPDEAESTLRRFLAWNGRENVYAAGRVFFVGWGYRGVDQPGHGPRDLEAWSRFWRSPETGSVQGRVRYQGGDLVARLADAPEKLTPGDFRLSADSSGYRAGPDGKDLGADVDLVGPGPAYVLWKKTPEYQDWRNETGQLK